jgi:hypothetical protein
VKVLGMTDKQFDTYQRALLRDLKRIKAELAKAAQGVELEALEVLIDDTENQLQRP